MQGLSAGLVQQHMTFLQAKSSELKGALEAGGGFVWELSLPKTAEGESTYVFQQLNERCIIVNQLSLSRLHGVMVIPMCVAQATVYMFIAAVNAMQAH